MTHDFPSQEEKYLSLKKWIKRALSCRVGLKLDFKVRQAVEPSLSILKELSVNPERVILHADILKGPGGENPKFKPSEFLSRCREFSSKSLLSLGFTTVPDSSPFTTKMVKVALGLALRFPPATICLRLEKVTEKIVKMLQKEGVFVTFWSGQDDHLTIKGWKKAVLQIRQCKPFAFLDLPGFPKCLRQEISCPKRN